jgi:Zn-finger nucleic acid-binding protein
MQPVVIEGVELDRCFEHGVWFDGSELETLRQRPPLEPAVETGKREDQGGRNALQILIGTVEGWF